MCAMALFNAAKEDYAKLDADTPEEERSALHRAVAEGHAAAAARLCEERAGVAVRLIACKDAAGWGPMHTAAAKGLAAAVRAMAVVVSAHARELLESESQDAGGAGAFVLLQAD